MADIARRIRKVSRCLGIDVELVGNVLTATDTELYGQIFTMDLGTPSKHEASLSAFHEKVYRARGREQFLQQRGRCALCGGPMSGESNTEIDHIKSRGSNGRDDRRSNLRVVHGNPCHRARHGQ